MAKITREQVNKINQQAQNGFELDLWYFMCHSEKILMKKLRTSETEFIKFDLYFSEHYDHKTGETSIIPTLHMQNFTEQPDSQFSTSYGLGWTEQLGTAVPRRNMKILYEQSGRFSDEQLMELYREKSKKPSLFS